MQPDRNHLRRLRLAAQPRQIAKAQTTARRGWEGMIRAVVVTLHHRSQTIHQQNRHQQKTPEATPATGAPRHDHAADERKGGEARLFRFWLTTRALQTLQRPAPAILQRGWRAEATQTTKSPFVRINITMHLNSTHIAIQLTTGKTEEELIEQAQAMTFNPAAGNTEHQMRRIKGINASLTFAPYPDGLGNRYRTSKDIP